MSDLILSSLNIPALGPGGIDLTIEATGAPSCVQMGIHVLKPSYVYLVFLHTPATLITKSLPLLLDPVGRQSRDAQGT